MGDEAQPISTEAPSRKHFDIRIKFEYIKHCLGMTWYDLVMWAVPGMIADIVVPGLGPIWPSTLRAEQGPVT